MPHLVMSFVVVATGLILTSHSPNEDMVTKIYTQNFRIICSHQELVTDYEIMEDQKRATFTFSHYQQAQRRMLTKDKAHILGVLVVFVFCDTHIWSLTKKKKASLCRFAGKGDTPCFILFQKKKHSWMKANKSL